MEAPPKNRPDDRVPLRAKLAYGSAGVVDLWANNLPAQLVTPIFVTGLGLSPALISVAMLIFRLYSATIDPLMGWISDNTRTRWGRRKPYILAGTVLTGICFPVMWQVNPGWSDSAQFTWLLFSGLAFFTFFAVWAMPYQSMLLEMTPDYHERTSVSSWRSLFGQVGNLMIGWAWYLTQLPMFAQSTAAGPDPVAGARAVSVLAGVLVLSFGALPVVFVRERYYQKAALQQRVGLRDSFRRTFQNRPFVLIAGFTLFFCCVSSLTTTLGFYLRLYYVLNGDQALAARIQGVESSLFAVLGLLCVPWFNGLSRRVGKTRTLQLAVGLLLLAVIARWWTYTPQYPWLSMVSGLMLAPAFTGIWQMIPAINGDVVDFEELRSGERREGAFASIYSWIVKASFSIGAGLAGPLVVACGFEISHAAAQRADSYLYMRLVDLVLCGSMIVIALLMLRSYRLSPERMLAIRDELESRRGSL
jgi:GPH family glycoside/pentoside/hexuronide:cation symporter